MGRMVLEMPACLIPPLTAFCVAVGAAGVGTATAIENAVRHEKEKGNFERLRSLVDALARDDLRTRILSRLDERAVAHRFAFASRTAVESTSDTILAPDSARPETSPDALLRIDIEKPFIHAMSTPRPFRPDQRATRVTLSYTATLYTLPACASLAEMHRHVVHDIEGHPADIPQFVHHALSSLVDTVTGQIDAALVAPLATRDPDQAPVADAVGHESGIRPDSDRAEPSRESAMKTCLQTR